VLMQSWGGGSGRRCKFSTEKIIGAEFYFASESSSNGGCSALNFGFLEKNFRRLKFRGCNCLLFSLSP